MSKRLTFTLGLLLVAARPGSLHAQSYAVQVWDQLQEHWKTISKNSQDWYLQNYIMGRINQGGTDTWTFYFTKGTTYIITGACDNDCKNVDMTIKDESGAVVDQDTKDDDTPVLTLQPASSGKFSIEVQMTQCKEEPCYFGIGIFSK